MTTKLYPGIAFSPVAELTDNVGAGDTIIPVSDVEAFPPAPNLATIGTDEEGETVLYAAKTATALSGCTRGVEGTARAWSAGDPVARNWTAKDHDDLIAAVGEAAAAAQNAQAAAQEAKETSDPAGTAAATVADHNGDGSAHGELFAAKQPKLTGQPGQVVGFDSMGLAYAVRGWSNPNMLDNWYFVDPVNQRGAGGTITAAGYFIDRWKLVSGSITLGADGLVLNGTIAQILETAPTSAVTARALTGAGIMPADYDTATKTVSITGSGIPIIAAKLELGPVQTLAHQDADGNWVLNDPPPNKALELLKCQRYQVVEVGGVSEMPGRTETNDTLFTLFIPTAIRMRANPTVTIPGLIIAGNGKAIARDVTAITGSVHEGGINISFKLEESSGIGALQALFCHAPNGYTLDANL